MSRHCPNCFEKAPTSSARVIVCAVCTAALVERDGRLSLVDERRLPDTARADLKRQREVIVDALTSTASVESSRVA